MWGSPETTKTLVEAADAAGVLLQLLEDRTEDFSICLHHAADWGSPEVLAALLDAADSAGVLVNLRVLMKIRPPYDGSFGPSVSLCLPSGPLV